jgi:hypothetical protein
MALIDSEDAAGRLARVIVSDIQLYNRQKLATGVDIAAEVQEGYAHFRSRVVPALLPLFEMVLADHGLLAGKLPGSLSAGPRPARPAAAPLPEPDPEPEATTEKIRTPPPSETSEPPEPEPEPAPPPTLPIAAVDSDSEPEPGESTQVDTPAMLVEPDPVPAAADSEAAARRWARVIISDIEIYNPDKIANGGDLSREINEGRALFRSRVEPRLLSIFETILGERGLGTKAPVKAVAVVPEAPAVFDAPTPLVVPGARTAPSDAPTPALVPVPAAASVAPAAASAPPAERAPEAHTPLVVPTARWERDPADPAADVITPPPAAAPEPRKTRPRAVPPPLPIEERPRWAASSPDVPAAVLASLPDPAPQPRTETPELVITVASNPDPTPAPVLTSAIGPADSAFGVTPLARPPAVVTMPVSAALQPRPASHRWIVIAVLGAAVALAVYLLSF